MMYWDLGKVFSYGEKALGKTGKPGAGKKYDCSERQNRQRQNLNLAERVKTTEKQ